MNSRPLKSSFAALLLGLLLSSVSASDIVFQSASSTATFTPLLSAEWFTFVDGDNLPKIRVSITVKDVDITDWGTQGNMGYWVGMGFGSQVMTDADIVMCAFTYSGAAAND